MMIFGYHELKTSAELIQLDVQAKLQEIELDSFVICTGAPKTKVLTYTLRKSIKSIVLRQTGFGIATGRRGETRRLLHIQRS
ncbi:hypothetical protein RHGRI_033658 [Rhododendron griersonianum]|uniref:Ribosomal protein S13 n=1 Tax=Rhododendron griersonianum TaxID=479676 RepID=A0AAV6I3C1_9ERIC|nr:hypothetical protein RHGRI_033658 [Rhododendron griersonianum]